MDLIAECEAYEVIKGFAKLVLAKDKVVMFADIVKCTGYEAGFVSRAWIKLEEEGIIGQTWTIDKLG